MGSAAYGTIIRAGGVEKELYRALKNYILSLSTRITCENDPDVEFDVGTKGTSYTPTFNFSIDGTHVFKIYRPDTLGNSVFAINVAMDAVAGIPSSANSIFFRSDGYHENWDKISYDTVYDRGIMISHIVNDTLIYLSFACWNADQGNRNSSNMSLLNTVSNDTMFIGSAYSQSTYNKARCYNLSDWTLYNASNLISGTFLSRFSYACLPGAIDYIKSTIYQNNNEKAFDNSAIYDCTTVTIGDTIALEDGAYVAVGTHQLVKVLDS